VTEDDRTRRPPRRRRPEGNRRRELDPAERRERDEQRFVEDLEARIRFFLLSEDGELELEPMNSYKRRLAHKVAMQYKLGTESRGEEPNRLVALLRTEEAEVPEERVQRVRMWDFGTQTFPINPGPDGVHLALKQDGSIELWNEDDKHRYVTDRHVTSRQIRIRQSKIVMPDDPEW
jgi:hypothetical protein